MFNTYTIRHIGPPTHQNTLEHLSKALARQNITEIKLKLHFAIDATCDIKENMLSRLQNNVISLDHQIDDNQRENYLFLTLKFSKLESITMNLYKVRNKTVAKHICENFISKHYQTIQQMSIKGLNLEDDSVLLLPTLPRLNDLHLQKVHGLNALSFMKSGEDTIENLILDHVSMKENYINNLSMSNLTKLTLIATSAKAGLAIIEKVSTTITHLYVKNVDFDQADCNDHSIPNLINLNLQNVNGIYSMELIKKVEDTISELTIEKISFQGAEIENLKMLKLKTLNFSKIDGKIISDFIEVSKNTLSELNISYCNGFLPSNDLMIPNLKKICASNIDSEFAESLNRAAMYNGCRFIFRNIY